MPRSIPAAALIAAALCAGLSACKARPDGDAIDDTVANGVDSALTRALAKRIVVDPGRIGMATPRSPAGEAAAAGPEGSPCDIRYDAAWARRLPAELPVYPGATLSEAAGTDAHGCRRRIASFTSSAPAPTVVAYYDMRARRAGYTAEHLVEDGADVLGGTRGDAAYYITITPARGGGSAVDLIASPGN